MARNLASLAARLNRLADDLDEIEKDAKTVVGMAVMNHLVNNTPVDTSQALSNWSASGGEIPGFHGPHVAGEMGSTRGASASIALSEARAVMDALPPQTPLVISNAAPYIRRLDEGHSRQHAGGFVAAAILVGKMALRNFKPFRGR